MVDEMAKHTGEVIKMTQRELIRLLRAVHELDVAEHEKRIAVERANCLPITRAREIALNPTLLTKSERRHLNVCRYCARLVEIVTKHARQ